MSSTITIGLTHTGVEEKHLNYVRWLQGSDPIDVVELSEKKKNAARISECDALILSGGIDIHPKFYGQAKTSYPHAPRPFHEERDEFEIALFHQAQQLGLPVLGICRGLQLINCIFGGSLKQDLGDEQNMIHKATVIDHLQADKVHGVTMEKASVLHDICGDRMAVNSAHHQCIERVGEGLHVNCRSDDGIIEGFERDISAATPFLLAVQWHPERMFRFGQEATPASRAIRDRFIQEIKKGNNANH